MGDGGGRDAGASDAGTDAGPDQGPPDLGPCPDRVPSGPYGSDVGDPLVPFRFPDCAGEEQALYGLAHCTASVTVVNVAAGWCEPCFQETEELQAEIVERYGGAVRVVQLLFQDASYGDVDGAECNAWVERFGTVGVETLVATIAEVGPYLVDDSVPSTLVLDRDGRVRLTLDGTEPGLPNVRAAIDAVLPE